jgi:hypothetical protein
VTVDGVRMAAGGENTIAVFAIDQETGEPTLVQNVDTRGYHPRTFAIDPSGRLLIAANMTALPVRQGTELRTVPASLAVFRIGGDGLLEFVRRYDVPPGVGNPFWVAFLSPP